MDKYFFAIYKGDQFINLFETINEVADFLGISVSSAKWYTSPASRRSDCGNKTLVYKYLR